MLNGELYDANDEQLVKQRIQAKDLCYAFNHCLPSDTLKQQTIMQQLLGHIKGNYEIIAPFYCDYGYNITIGDNFFANHNTIILDGAKVSFGNNVFIAPNCGFYCASHPLDYQNRNKGLEYAYEIIVGDNVWIGANSCIVGKVKIGNNVVIGAGSVVVKDIPDNCLAYGNPCKVIRKI